MSTEYFTHADVLAAGRADGTTPEGQLMYTEPCTAANQITYLFFCTLKGLEHPRMRKIQRQDGNFAYHYLRY